MAKSRNHTPWTYIISTALLICIFTLTYLTLGPISSILQSPEHASHPTSIFKPGPQADHTKPPTSFPYIFHEDKTLESLDVLNDANWASTMTTPGGGFLRVAHNETYQRGWGVSVFHAMHCVAMLRASFQTYLGFTSADSGHGHGGHHSRGFDPSRVDERKHIEHCLGYISRALLCNGDDTLEPPIGELDEAGNVLWSATSGEGVMHQCRDSSLAWKMVMQSEEAPIGKFDWVPGDTIRSVFGR